MTRTISFISIIGAALVLAAPAFGQGSRYSFEKPQWQQALEARSEGLNRQHGLGDYDPALRALELRSMALNEQYGLGGDNLSPVDRLVAQEQAFEVRGQVDSTPAVTVAGRGLTESLAARSSRVDSTSAIDAREEAFGAKREAQLVAGGAPDVFERTVVGSTRETTPVNYDWRDFVAQDVNPTTSPVSVATTSDREIEWPQIGIGLGMGLLLGLGLVLAVRYTRIRPLAH